MPFSRGAVQGAQIAQNRIRLQAQLEDRQRVQEQEDAVRQALDNTLQPNQAAMLEQQMSARLQSLEDKRNRMYADDALAQGVLNDDWSRANDGLKDPDTSGYAEFMQGEGILGFQAFDANNAEQVRQRDKVAQDDFGSTYDMLDPEQQQFIDKNLVVYNKGAGQVEVADKWDLAASTGLTERNTKFKSGFDAYMDELESYTQEGREAGANIKRQAGEKLRVEQEKLKALKSDYTPITKPEPKSEPGQQAAADITKHPVYKTALEMIKSDIPEVRQNAGQLLNSLGMQVDVEALGKQTPEDIEQVLANQIAARENAEAQQFADTAKGMNMSPEQLRLAISKGDIRGVYSDAGKLIRYEPVPEDERTAQKSSITVQDQAVAMGIVDSLKAQAEATGIDFNDFTTWTPDFTYSALAEAGKYNDLVEISVPDSARKDFGRITSAIGAGERIKEDLRSEHVGPIDDLVNRVLAYTELSDPGERTAKEAEMAAILMAVSASDRTSKYLVEKLIEVSNASGKYGANAVLGGLNRLLRNYSGTIGGLKLSLAQNPIYGQILKSTERDLNGLIADVDKRLKGNLDTLPKPEVKEGEVFS